MVINPIVGVYIPIIMIPIKGGMTIPNIATLDPGSFGWLWVFFVACSYRSGLGVACLNQVPRFSYGRVEIANTFLPNEGWFVELRVSW